MCLETSVVLLTYNRARALHNSIPAILNQTYRDFELLIADDASTDDTEIVCRRYAAADGRIRYQRRTRNQGMPGNLNLALKEASGEYVAVLHDDDIYRPEMLETWRGALARYPEAAFVFNAYRALTSDGREACTYREDLPHSFPGALLLERYYFRRWRFTSPVWGCAMVRKSAVERCGYFEERFGFWADVDMWMRLSEQNDVAYVDKPLISISSIESYPHQFDDRSAKRQAILETMFNEARVRHYRGIPAKARLEMMRHYSFVAANRSFEALCKVQRMFRAAMVRCR